MICRKAETTKAVPLYEVATKSETTVIDMLPALLAITEYDTTSSVCSKNTTLNTTAETSSVENLVAFE